MAKMLLRPVLTALPSSSVTFEEAGRKARKIEGRKKIQGRKRGEREKWRKGEKM